jgi:excisionase family DNA binding protein
MSRPRDRYVPADADRWVSPAEAATVMGCSASTVRETCHAGKLAFSRLGRLNTRMSIKVADIHAYMDQQRVFGQTTSRALATVHPMRRVRRCLSPPAERE